MTKSFSTIFWVYKLFPTCLKITSKLTSFTRRRYSTSRLRKDTLDERKESDLNYDKTCLDTLLLITTSCERRWYMTRVHVGVECFQHVSSDSYICFIIRPGSRKSIFLIIPFPEDTRELIVFVFVNRRFVRSWHSLRNNSFWCRDFLAIVRLLLFYFLFLSSYRSGSVSAGKKIVLIAFRVMYERFARNINLKSVHDSQDFVVSLFWFVDWNFSSSLIDVKMIFTFLTYYWYIIDQIRNVYFATCLDREGHSSSPPLRIENCPSIKDNSRNDDTIPISVSKSSVKVIALYIIFKSLYADTKSFRFLSLSCPLRHFSAFTTIA